MPSDLGSQNRPARKGLCQLKGIIVAVTQWPNDKHGKKIPGLEELFILVNNSLGKENSVIGDCAANNSYMIMVCLLLPCVRVLRRPVIRPDVQLQRLAIVAEGGD